MGDWSCGEGPPEGPAGLVQTCRPPNAGWAPTALSPGAALRLMGEQTGHQWEGWGMHSAPMSPSDFSPSDFSPSETSHCPP